MTRTAFYPKKNRDGTTRPGTYQHLAEEFERRRKLLLDAGAIVDPRTAQIERVKGANTKLRSQLDQQKTEISELETFKLLAQHLEIERLRTEASAGGKVTTLAIRRPTTGRNIEHSTYG
ncbi:hypothetical protein [Streptomyces sp. NPDC014894]|uniref:hypothetical protein n=1 Tax=Streptomyces sp. NPDC014894 TaxID=3364931 RepID=UPI0036FE33C6